MLITVGAFDGFHKGHEKLFEACRENSLNNDWGVVTFSPHPAEYFGKLNHAMFTLKERGFLSKILGIPNFIVFNFDEDFKNLSPEEFMNILIKNFHADGLVIGSDFHFGHEKLGSAEWLEKVCSGKIKIFRLNLFDKKIYSSSRAREKVLSGDVENVKEILGYPFFMISDIIHGNERGRSMNFPTANINLENRIIPADGVYATAVLVNHEFHCGALSIGNNPTFHDVFEKRAEVFITDFSGDIYGSEILVLFLKRIRDIKTFDNKEALINQIKLDTEACSEIFENSLGDNRTKKIFDKFRNIYYENQNFEPEVININDIKSCFNSRDIRL